MKDQVISMKSDLAEKTSDLKSLNRDKQRLEMKVKELEDKSAITEKELSALKDGNTSTASSEISVLEKEKEILKLTAEISTYKEIVKEKD
jgi:septal ring factor EnvC (AmiA/AmiB activator)